MKHLSVPVREVNGERWGALCLLGPLVFEVVSETWELKKDSYSFVGGHRVRLLKLKKNVHFKVPADIQGTELDISGIAPSTAPRRQGAR